MVTLHIEFTDASKAMRYVDCPETDITAVLQQQVIRHGQIKRCMLRHASLTVGVFLDVAEYLGE